MIPDPDRRRSPRFPFFAAAEITEIASSTKLTGRTSELSRFGCFMDMMNTLPLSTPVKLGITYEEQMFECAAHVTYTEPNIGMGVAFDEISLRDQRILEKWFSELQAV